MMFGFLKSWFKIPTFKFRLHRCRGCGAYYDRLPRGHKHQEYQFWCPNHEVDNGGNNGAYWRSCYWRIFPDGSQGQEYPFE